MLLLTAGAYLWNLTASGYANSFYAAAVQAGTKSWKALFFGSLDSSNFITVDKPPASIWVMALSGRVFGFSSASMLVPQVLEGVGAVGFLHAAVKRSFGAGAGLAAGALLAITPVAALMFRFNNPDALLVLLLVAGGYSLMRALAHASTGWVVAAGALVGAAFLAKMAEALLVVPAFALAYGVAAPTALRRRTLQLLAGGLALTASAGWWVLAVALWPAASRPMIDGSPNNSILNLIAGYNGLGRVVGSGGVSFAGQTGPLRLFNSLMGGQASWLLPAALVALIGGLWERRHAPRTDRARAALLLWGGWLLVSAAVFSFGQGVIHPYYAIALAPAIAALAGIGTTIWWRQRENAAARLLAAFVLATSAVWACVLLARTPAWNHWLIALIALTGALGVLGVLGASPGRMPSRALAATLGAGVVSVVSGPLAYAAYTIESPHGGTIVWAGPRTGVLTPSAAATTGRPLADSRRAALAPSAIAFAVADVQNNTALVGALRSDAAGHRWAAATGGSRNAASLELASGQAVMAIGGFSDEGGNLSLASFQRYVRRGAVRYFIPPPALGKGSVGGSSFATIDAWVGHTYRSTRMQGVAVFDLAARR
ncbi:MAG: ArnT family glycosyltransferase [Solirubrobacteraceae bacterium]